MFKRTFAALTILAAILGFMGNGAHAAKPDQWLIYWYVCGTDIETTRIAFGSATDLMSDDPNDLILAEPDREPGDATRSIKEVEKAALSPNVKIFMQAGGTYIWGHEKFRDLNAKIQTKVEVILSDGNGNPLKETDENGDPIKDEDGNDKYQTLYGEVIKNIGIKVDRWYLDEYATDENGEYVKDENGNRIQNFVPVENGQLGRYVYDKDHRNWHPREQIPISDDPNTDMGSKEGLISFLQAGQELERELYPDGNVRRILILKDHGDGTSICEDEYTKNIIPVEAIKEAFNEVQGDWANPDEKPFEVVVFDACLMSTYETAVALEDAANYMVASQEVTSGKGNMNYTDLLNELSKNPAMSGKEFAKIICNTGWEDTKVVDKDFRMNTNAIFTSSVVDLSEQKMDALKTAYANFNEEATKVAKENPSEIRYTYSKFKNAANIAERYPSHLDISKQDLIDLKNFTNNIKTVFPELKDAGNDLVKAINNSVVYNKRGDVLNRGGGLSTQISTNFYGILKNNVQEKSIDLSELKDEPVFVDPEKKTARVELSEEELKNVESVRYQILYLRPYKDNNYVERLKVLFLGGDSDMKEDRQTGTFESVFPNKWIVLDGNPLLVQVVSDSTRKDKNGKKVSGKDLCVSPISLNGEWCKLFFSRSYPNEKITLIGVVPYNDSKLPSGEIKSLKKGDVVTPLYFLFDRSEAPDDFMGKIAEGYPITIGDKPKIEKGTLPNGRYAYVFRFVNPVDDRGDVITMQSAIFKIKDGKVVEVKDAELIEGISDLED